MSARIGRINKLLKESPLFSRFGWTVATSQYVGGGLIGDNVIEIARNRIHPTWMLIYMSLNSLLTEGKYW